MDGDMASENRKRPQPQVVVSFRQVRFTPAQAATWHRLFERLLAQPTEEPRDRHSADPSRYGDSPEPQSLQDNRTVGTREHQQRRKRKEESDAEMED